MSEPWPDALFGVDGTELAAPSDRSRRPDPAVPPPFVLPPIPNLGMTREAVAAALGDEPAQPADQEPVAKPAASPSATPAPPQPSAAQPGAGQANATAQLPAAPAQPPAGPPTGYNQRPVIAAPVPAQSSRYRRPLVVGSHPPGIAGNIRRRVATQTRSNGGAGAFFIVISIVFVVLLYFIISGIVEAFVRLIP